MKGVILTGGTGGHIFPAIAIGRVFEKSGYQIEYIIVGNKMGKLPAPGITTRYYSANSPLSGNILKRLWHAIQLFILLIKGFFILKHTDFVIGTGSFASFSILLAARLKGIKTYMLEQNSIPGRVTRFFSKRKTKTFISFPDSKSYLQGPSVFSGNPIREEAKTTLCKKDAKKSLGIRTHDKVILVLGGSLGAYRFAEKILKLSIKFPTFFFIVQTGRHHKNLSSVFGERRENHYLIPFHPKPGILYSAADYIIARAGAGTIYELSYHKKPAIFVPFPYAQDNHQYYNALYVKEHGAGLLINEGELNEKTLKEALDTLEQHAPSIGKKLGELFPHNAEDIILKEIEHDLGKV